MKYGSDKTKEICEKLRSGNSRNDACILSDINQDTFYEWLKKPEFSEAVKKAEIEFKERNIMLIQAAAIKSWQAAAWLLERKYSEEYALKQKQDHNVSPDAALRMAETTLKLMRELNANGITTDTRISSSRP